MSAVNSSGPKALNIDVHGRSFNKTLLLMAILVGTFIAVLNQTILSTALPQLMKYFDIDANQVQWVTTAYMLTNGIMIPMTALLLEKISTKKLFMFAMFSFGCGTALCALCPSYEVLLLGRILQAVGAGIMMPLVNTVFILTFPVEKRGMAMGIYGLVISFAPAIGPTLARFVIDRWDWHYLFYALIPIIILDIVFAFFYMKDIVPQKQVKLDILSIMLSSLGFGSILFGFSSAGSRGWSDPAILITIILGLVVVAGFLWRQLTVEHPMLHLQVFNNKTFTLTTVISSIVFITHAGSTVIVPIFIQSVQGRSAYVSGLALLPGALIMAFVMLISGHLFDKYGAKRLLLPGILLIAISSVPYTHLQLDTSIVHLTIYNALRYIGIGMVLMPLQTAGINALRNDLVHHATAVINTSRQIVGSIGTAILITVMTSTANSYAPSKSMASTNAVQYHTELLHSTIRGMNTAFMCLIGVSLLALIFSFFINKIEQPHHERDAADNLVFEIEEAVS